MGTFIWPELVTLDLEQAHGVSLDRYGLDPLNTPLVAVPAIRTDQGWQVSLEFYARPRLPDDGVTLRKHDTRSQTYSDVPCGLTDVALHIDVHRWKVSGGGRIPSALPVSLYGSGLTRPVEQAAAGRPSRPTFTPAMAEYGRHVLAVTGLQVSQVSAATKLAVDQGRIQVQAEVLAQDGHLRRPEALPDIIGIDELAVKGKYWTIISDSSVIDGQLRPSHQRLLAIVPSREEEEVTNTLKEIAGWYGGISGPMVTVDAWEDFRTAVNRAFAGRSVTIVPDRFHLVRHRARHWRAVQNACLGTLTEKTKKAVRSCSGRPCVCRQSCCARYRDAAALNDELQALWEAADGFDLRQCWHSWKDHRSRYVRRYGNWEDFRAVESLWDAWATEIEQLFTQKSSLGRFRSNGPVEGFHRTVSRTIRRLRLTYSSGPQAEPAVLSRQVEAAMQTEVDLSVICAPQRAYVPVEVLRCPECQSSDLSLPDRPVFCGVADLPRGLHPVTLQMPVSVTCGMCGPVQRAGPDRTPSMTPRLTGWIQAPAQALLGDRALSQMTGLNPRRIAQLRSEILCVPPATYPRTLLCAEVWLPTTVWVLFCTPAGRLVDALPVSRRDSEEFMSWPATRGMVEEEVIRALERGRPPENYRVVQLQLNTPSLRDCLCGQLPLAVTLFIGHKLGARLLNQARDSLLARCPGQTARQLLQADLRRQRELAHQGQPIENEYHAWTELVRTVQTLTEILQSKDSNRGSLWKRLEVWTAALSTSPLLAEFGPQRLQAAKELEEWSVE